MPERDGSMLTWTREELERAPELVREKTGRSTEEVVSRIRDRLGMKDGDTLHEYLSATPTMPRAGRTLYDRYLAFSSKLNQSKADFGATVYRVGNLWEAHSREWGRRGGYMTDGLCVRPPHPWMWLEAQSNDPTRDVHPCAFVGHGTWAPWAREKWLASGGTEEFEVISLHLWLMARGDFQPNGACHMFFPKNGFVKTGARAYFEEPPSDLALRTMEFVLYVLSFLNCRNIEVVESPPPRQMIRAAIRRGEDAPITYRTINILPIGKTRIDRVASDAHPGVARHVCRGHFKRYTADRPLLGKFVGQFWWPQHVRGDDTLGVVFKDYEIQTALSPVP